MQRSAINSTHSHPRSSYTDVLRVKFCVTLVKFRHIHQGLGNDWWHCFKWDAHLKWDVSCVCVTLHSTLNLFGKVCRTTSSVQVIWKLYGQLYIAGALSSCVSAWQQSIYLVLLDETQGSWQNVDIFSITVYPLVLHVLVDTLIFVASHMFLSKAHSTEWVM